MTDAGDGTPPQGLGASGAPFVQRRMAARRGGLHRQLLESTARAAAGMLAAQLMETVSGW